MVDPVELQSLVHRMRTLFDRTNKELLAIRVDAIDGGFNPDAVLKVATKAAPGTSADELVEAYRRARGG